MLEIRNLMYKYGVVFDFFHVMHVYHLLIVCHFTANYNVSLKDILTSYIYDT